MYKILNMCDFSSVNDLRNSMDFYKEKFQFDGFEMIKFTSKDISALKKDIKGYHFRFFPCWMDLYRENFDKLYEELVTIENIKSLCGGTTKKELVDFYKNELKRATELEVEYVVFHPCNIYIKESLHYNFYYSNMEVLEVVAEFLNEVFQGVDTEVTLLLENLWWPGLRLDNYEEADYLMKNIRYPHKGFLLDTGHMLNNNRELKNSDEGIEYIKASIENLREYKEHIYGVHLNFSLSGEYTNNAIKENEKIESIDIAMEKVYPHISKVDSHQPFENNKIVDVLNIIPVKYLVYELISIDSKKLIDGILKQDKCIENYLK